MKLAQIIVNDFDGAPVAEHNFPCAVCQDLPAVLHLPTGIFHPCRLCQSVGWRLFNPPRWLERLISRWLE